MNHSWIVLLTAVTTACATRSGTTSRADAAQTNGFQATAHTPASDDRNSSTAANAPGREAQHVATDSAAPVSRNWARTSTGSAVENNASAQSMTASDQRSSGDGRSPKTRFVDDTTTNTLQPASGPGAASENGAGEHQKNADADKDNSRANQRDRSGKSLTPIDQGGNEADRKITQQIRQAIVGDESLSFNAKNIKIITTRGKVTLRGPVKSDTERSAIDAIAKQIAGAGNVENLVEVSK